MLVCFGFGFFCNLSTYNKLQCFFKEDGENYLISLYKPETHKQSYIRVGGIL